MTVATASHAVEDGNKQETSAKALTILRARSYQLDLISVATSNNVSNVGRSLSACTSILRNQ